MNKKLTKKQKVFADEYLNSGNAGLSAGIAYKVKNNKTARSIGSENLTKPNIKEYIEAQSLEAMSRIVELSINATNESVKLRANQDIVDRGGYRKIESVSLKIEHTDTDINPNIKTIVDRFEAELKSTYLS